jgi:hypothetical protein
VADPNAAVDKRDKRNTAAQAWHMRVRREYAWALAHARAERVWANARMARRHAHAIAHAYVRELGLTGEARSKSRQAWAEIEFEAVADSKGTWEWTIADGPCKGRSVDASYVKLVIGGAA